MHVLNKFSKANKNRFATSRVSMSSFGSLLESIRETDGNLEEDEDAKSN